WMAREFVPDSTSDPPGSAQCARSFQTTHWSVVVQARDRASAEAGEALATLCRAYWYPLYAYIRRRTSSAEQAENLTQEFFTRFLAREFLALADPARGKFRAFLLTCCKHFLVNEHQRAQAGKRGGGRPPL